MRRLAAALFSLICAAPLGAYAHPHVFIDTGLTLYFDPEGRLAEVKVVWAYDEFYSLLVTEDYGLDPDFDGVLTAEENAKITGFDMQWVQGFNGDLEIFEGDRLLNLSGPQDYAARYEDGRIITTHLRAVSADQTPGTDLLIKPYDATYYTAYDVTRGVDVEGTSACRTRVQMPDITAGLQALREELSALDPDIDPIDAGMPNIGEQLASKVYVTCDPY